MGVVEAIKLKLEVNASLVLSVQLLMLSKILVFVLVTKFMTIMLIHAIWIADHLIIWIKVIASALKDKLIIIRDVSSVQLEHFQAQIRKIVSAKVD